MQMMAMHTKESSINSKAKSTWKRNLFGKRSYRCWKAYDCSTRTKLCTEIWSRPTFSCMKMEGQNLVISMCQKLIVMNFWGLKRARPITLLPRCGKSNRMTWKRTYGRSVQCSTNCALWRHLSRLKICMDCSKRCWRGSTHRFQLIFPWTWDNWLRLCCLLIQATDRPAMKFWNFRTCRNESGSISQIKMANFFQLCKIQLKHRKRVYTYRSG